MEGPASGGMLAQQLSVLVQCHACQATLQVSLCLHRRQKGFR